MKAFLTSTHYGFFLVDDQGRVIASKRRTGDDDRDLSSLLEGFSDHELETIEPGLANRARLVEPWPGCAGLYSHERYASSLGLDYRDLISSLRDAVVSDTRKRIASASGEQDRLAAEAVKAVDEFDKTLNVFASRIREWYGLHFPELDEIVDDNASYLRIVWLVGLRHNFTEEALSALGFPEEKVRRMIQKSRQSMGAPLSEENFEPIRVMAQAVYQLYSLRNSLSGYIDRLMADVAPNLREFTGSVLGARLIALAGSLERLARFPSSTVQVLGAERALFRAIRRGARPPKHGAIFQDPLIHTAPKWQRGKIARAYAGKISIAARVDYYGGEDIADRLRSEFEQRVNRIRQSFPNPPENREERERPRRGSRRQSGRRWKRR